MTNRRFFLFVSFLMLISLSLYSYDLSLSLSDRNELDSLNAIIKGGEITSEGFRVTSQNTGLIIPLPQGINPSQGYLKIKMTKFPQSWPHEPDICPDPGVGSPWAKTVFGMGISPDNLWEGEGGPGFIESHYLRCENPCDSGYQGAFRHKFKGAGAQDTCWATTVMSYYFCNDSGHILEIEHRWDISGHYWVLEDGIEKTARGESCGVLDKNFRWYIHIAHGNDNEFATNGDITGAVFFDLVVHFDDVNSFCGDGICNANENCSDCPQDCGCKSPCYICKQNKCECNSPNYECPSCIPSCSQNAILNQTSTLCCGKNSICATGKREFESYDCNLCCEGFDCIVENLNDAGEGDTPAEDMVEKNDLDENSDINGFEDIYNGTEESIDHGSAVELTSTDVDVLRFDISSGSESRENSGCSCEYLK